MAGSKQIRIGRIERLIGEWETMIEILERSQEMEGVANAYTVIRIKTMKAIIMDLKEAIGRVDDL